MDTSGHRYCDQYQKRYVIHTVEPICYRGKFLFFMVNQMKNKKINIFIMYSGLPLSLAALLNNIFSSGMHKKVIPVSTANTAIPMANYVLCTVKHIKE